MAIAEVAAAEASAPGDVRFVSDEPLRRGRRLWLAAAVYTVVGLALLYVSLDVLFETTPVVVISLAVAGLMALFRAFASAGRALRGPGFDAGLWLSVTWMTLLIGAAAFADLLPLGNVSNLAESGSTIGNTPPDLFSAHPLGTNNFSFDLLARSIVAARVSLGTVFLAAVVGFVIGGAIGLCAGYFRGPTDATVGVFNDTLLAVPALVLLIAIFAVIGQPTSVPESIVKEGLALAFIALPTITRVARANTLKYAQREFVLSASAVGAKRSRIIIRELLPNVALPLISYLLIIMAGLMIAAGSLAFLGLGLQPPEPTWGNMIAEGAGGGINIQTLQQHPHVALIPGAFLFLTVFSLSRIGESARRRWDTAEAKV